MTDNAFGAGGPEPTGTDLRRAAEMVLAWRRRDDHLGGTVMAEARRDNRVSFLVAALAFMVNRELDRTAAEHGEEAVEAGLRHMIAAIAANDNNDGTANQDDDAPS